MKILFPVTCLLTFFVHVAKGQSSAAWPLDPVTRRIHYQGLVQVAGVSQAELLARACMWATGTAAPNTPPVIMHQPDTDVVLMAAAQPFAYTFALADNADGRLRNRTINLTLYYTVRLYLREGRYRYEAMDFAFAEPKNSEREPAELELIESKALNDTGARMIDAIRKRFQATTATLLAQLQEAMRKAE